MNRSEFKRLLKKNKPRVPVGSPEFDVSQLKALQRQATEKFKQELLSIKTNHEKLTDYVDGAINQGNIEVQEDFQARLSETSSTFEMSLTTLEQNFEMSLTTLEQNFEQHVEELHEEIKKTNSALQKTVGSLERRIDKNAKFIESEIAKLRDSQ